MHAKLIQVLHALLNFNWLVWNFIKLCKIACALHLNIKSGQTKIYFMKDIFYNNILEKFEKVLMIEVIT